MAAAAPLVLGWGATIAGWAGAAATGAGAFIATGVGAAALGRMLTVATNQAGQAMNYSRAKATIEYVYAFMKRVLSETVTVTDPRIKSGIVNFLAEIFSGRFSPTVMITLICVACVNIVLRKNFSSGFTKLIIRSSNDILDALQNVSLHSGKGLYYILKKVAQLIEHMVSHYGRHILETILYYVIGYGKNVTNPKTTTDVRTVIKDLEKAENKATAVLQAKVNKNNSPKIQANSLPELEIKAAMAGATAKHKKQMEMLQSKTPTNKSNHQGILKIKKAQFKKHLEYKILMEQYRKKLDAYKTPHIKVPSPPIPQQIAKINKSIHTIVKNSPSPNNNNNSPSPKKKTPSPKFSPSQVYSAVAGLKKKKQVHWWNGA